MYDKYDDDEEIKKRTVTDFECFCTSHIGDKNILEGDEIVCDGCLSYAFCNQCYNEEVEEFLQHEYECEEKMRKKVRRTRST